MIYLDGSFIKEGQFVNGKLSGYGREIYPNWYYIGDWKDDNRHGQGTYVFCNGTTYVGAWKNHKFHGPGKLTKADGTVFEGNWVEDMFNDIYWRDL